MGEGVEYAEKLQTGYQTESKHPYNVPARIYIAFMPIQLKQIEQDIKTYLISVVPGLTQGNFDVIEE